jgi:formate dehydrogenase major subunit
MGSNMAENHPVGFQWVMEARLRGAKVMHVDPRFTRTSAMSNLYVPIRAGTDIAFLGGIIHYILENERSFDEYVKAFTNAPVIVDERFRDTEDLDGSTTRARGTTPGCPSRRRQASARKAPRRASSPATALRRAA